MICKIFYTTYRFKFSVFSSCRFSTYLSLLLLEFGKHIFLYKYELLKAPTFTRNTFKKSTFQIQLHDTFCAKILIGSFLKCFQNTEIFFLSHKYVCVKKSSSWKRYIFWHYMNRQRGKVKEITKTLHNILTEPCRRF